MKKIILIIFTIMLGLFLVSCNNPKFSMPKLNEFNKVNLTESEYLEITKNLINTDKPLEIGMEIIGKTDGKSKESSSDINNKTEYRSTTKLDKDNNAVESIKYSSKSAHIENNEKKVITNQVTRTNYFVSKSDKLYYDLNQKIKTRGNFRSNNTKGKFFEEKGLENKYNYDFKFSDSIIKSDEFLKIVLSDYQHLNIYKTREIFKINFKYTKELAKDHEGIIKDFINVYQSDIVLGINLNYDFEFTLIYKENKFLSFNIDSIQNTKTDTLKMEESIRMYIKSDAKPPKFPNFNKYKEYQLNNNPII